MSDIDYAELFEISEETPEFADPAEDSGAPGEKVQETADPDDIEAWLETGPIDGEQFPDDGEPEGQPQAPDAQGELQNLQPVQTAEENAKYAAARRKAEAELALARETAVRERQAAVDTAYARMNLKNSYTGEPIKSEADYIAWQERFDADSTDAELEKAGLAPDTMNKIISSHPAVKKAEAAVMRLTQSERRIKAQRARVRIESELAEIGKMDPAIKGIGDIKAMPTYGRFVAAVENGATLTEAYKIANADTMIERRAAALAQSRINNAKSKGHLTGTESHGKGMATVPAEVIATYRNINPDMSLSEIQKHYNKYLSGV